MGRAANGSKWQCLAVSRRVHDVRRQRQLAELRGRQARRDLRLGPARDLARRILRRRRRARVAAFRGRLRVRHRARPLAGSPHPEGNLCPPRARRSRRIHTLEPRGIRAPSRGVLQSFADVGQRLPQPMGVPCQLHRTLLLNHRAHASCRRSFRSGVRGRTLHSPAGHGAAPGLTWRSAHGSRRLPKLRGPRVAARQPLGGRGRGHGDPLVRDPGSGRCAHRAPAGNVLTRLEPSLDRQCRDGPLGGHRARLQRVEQQRVSLHSICGADAVRSPQGRCRRKRVSSRAAAPN